MQWLGRDFPVMSNDEARKVSRRVAFIRHPLERLKSCYSFMYWLRDYGTPHRCGAPVDSWPEFVDHILAHDNMHWRPQSLIVEDVPNIYRRFEDLPECFSEYRPGILPHEHRTTRLPTTDYREADLREFYRDDFVLCGAA